MNSAANDIVVIGAGLTGLFLTHRLHLAGKNVTLLEARETLGGRYRRPSEAQPYSVPAVEFIPASSDHLTVLEWVKNQSPIPLSFTTNEHRAQIFLDGKWRPFAGFGETASASVGELSALFAHSHGIELQPGLDQLTRALSEQLPVPAKTQNQVTGFKVNADRVVEVIVNGEQSLRPQSVIFTPHLSQLNELFSGADLAPKHRTRLAKLNGWASLTLELSHPLPLVDDCSIRVFSSNAKEFEPVVGQVKAGRSKWMTLLPSEREADHEFVGQCCRHIKRQLKRAWPQLEFASSTPERISLQPHAYGQFSLRTKETYRLPELSNFYLANHALTTLSDDLGAVEVVRALETELCGPLNRLPDLSASC